LTLNKLNYRQLIRILKLIVTGDLNQKLLSEMNFIVNKHFKKDTEEYRKALLSVWNATAGFTMAFVMTILTAYDPVYGKVSYLPICITALASLIIIYKSGNLKLALDITCLSLLVAFIKPIMATGGVHSQVFIWLILSPIYALTLGDYKRGIFWTIITILVQISIYLFDNAHIDFNLAAEDKLSGLVNHIFFITTILSMMFAYEFIKNKQQNTIQNQLQILLEQREENLSMIQKLQKIEQALTLTNKELKSFAFAAAHDLKEHTRLIGMHVQVIQKKLSNEIDKQINEHMTFVLSGVKRMERVLVNLVEHEQVGNEMEEKVKLNLQEMCGFLMKKIKMNFPDIEVNFQMGNLPNIFYIEKDVTLLFLHLFNNSVKFRKNDEPLDIIIDCTENENQYLFKIADNGIGIEKDFQDKVFDLFSRFHNRKDYEGSGIGLATCKKIVTNMGGDIWLQNTEGKGTTVCFSVSKPNVSTLPAISNDLQRLAA
jgi:signal transduction histidine kinase